MKAVLVGGAGFVGTHLAGELVQRGHQVTIYDLRVPGSLPPGVRYIAGDLFEAQPSGLVEAIRDAQVAYHLAWRYLPSSSNLHMQRDVQENLLGSLVLLRCCVEAGVGRVVFFSSGGSVYGQAQALPIPETHPAEPLTSHAINKLAVEKYLAVFERVYGLDYVILRPANPYGPYQDPGGGLGIVAACMARAAANRPIEVWGDGSVVRDYFYVEDLARAAILAGETTHSRTVYNIGSGEGRTVRQLLEAISQISGRALEVRWLAGRASDVQANVLDAAKAHKLLGWELQVPLEEGLRRTWLYFAGSHS